jgi:DNA-binding NarL/FixJ family response regulator
MATELSIVIADDHPIFRRGLRCVVEAEAGLRVLGEAADGEAALALLRAHAPDVAVLDLDMPNRDGLDVAREARESGLATRVIILTMHTSEALFNRALDLGVRGYVLKDSALVEIVSAVRAVASGRSYISPQMSGHLLTRRARADALASERPGLHDLTPAERRVLRLIADDRTSREIADALFISVRTVEHHRANICHKLDLHGANALLRFALEHKSELQ